jgi:hypothetical protein
VPCCGNVTNHTLFLPVYCDTIGANMSRHATTVALGLTIAGTITPLLDSHMCDREETQNVCLPVAGHLTDMQDREPDLPLSKQVIAAVGSSSSYVPPLRQAMHAALFDRPDSGHWAAQEVLRQRRHQIAALLASNNTVPPTQVTSDV